MIPLVQRCSIFKTVQFKRYRHWMFREHQRGKLLLDSGLSAQDFFNGTCYPMTYQAFVAPVQRHRLHFARHPHLIAW